MQEISFNESGFVGDPPVEIVRLCETGDYGGAAAMLLVTPDGDGSADPDLERRVLELLDRCLTLSAARHRVEEAASGLSHARRAALEELRAIAAGPDGGRRSKLVRPGRRGVGDPAAWLLPPPVRGAGDRHRAAGEGDGAAPVPGHPVGHRGAQGSAGRTVLARSGRAAKRWLHEAIYTIRRVLAVGDVADRLRFDGDRYSFGDEDRWRDVDRLESCARQARTPR